MQQLVLGTAQLGMDYGINNAKGKPLLNEAFDILDTAYENGINILDTATAYGNSEKIIGMYMQEKKRTFKIATKLPKLDRSSNFKQQINYNFNNSIDKLGVDRIDYYLVHSFTDVIKCPEIIKELLRLKEAGNIDKIGVSIYNVNELEYILQQMHEHIDIVQIPFNIFDLRWIKSGLLEKANTKNIEISVRSIFLQGLFFADKDKSDEIHKNCYHYINELRELCKNEECDLNNMLFGFAKYFNFLSHLLIGCETKKQLIDNINSFNNSFNFTESKIETILHKFGNVEEKIIDPRKWK